MNKLTTTGAAGWNDSIWNFGNNQQYPRLAWESDTGAANNDEQQQ